MAQEKDTPMVEFHQSRLGRERVEGGNGHTRKAFAYTSARASGYT
ncbi:hypothetical protein BofuT4_uP129710.1 [Botrytis cinerea T4]|uniref:Uncharacterized protein n=1 Tax=Botryotinia fuckeliana (strain T4) TaxID=999810 RepID=G2YRM3_BOTF4|nr:hypothetical protein BofuT4_uP129710.1 [Botrytis cinerea T4]